MLDSRTGNPLSCESFEAANLYCEAVALILGSESSAADTLDKALALDGDFALAAAARYYVANDTGEPDAIAYRERARQASSNATGWDSLPVKRGNASVAANLLNGLCRSGPRHSIPFMAWRMCCMMMGHPFIALHVAGLYASAGDLAGLRRCAETIAGSPGGANRDVSLVLVSALSDFVKGDYQQATQTLATISPGARIGIGCSNVERILVELLESRSQALQSTSL